MTLTFDTPNSQSTYFPQAQDWPHPGARRSTTGIWDPARDGSVDEYLRTVPVPQVHELLSHYGSVAVLWWDTPADIPPRARRAPGRAAEAAAEHHGSLVNLRQIILTPQSK